MADAKLIELLGGWDGCSLGTAGRMATDSSREAVRIMYDQFHVVAKYGRAVADAVRTEEARRAPSCGARQVIKGSRCLPLGNGENLKRRDRLKLKELLKVNHRRATVYVLKDDPKSLWTYRRPNGAMQFWREWKARAMHSASKLLKGFTRRLGTRRPPIARWRVARSALAIRAYGFTSPPSEMSFAYESAG